MSRLITGKPFPFVYWGGAGLALLLLGLASRTIAPVVIRRSLTGGFPFGTRRTTEAGVVETALTRWASLEPELLFVYVTSTLLLFLVLLLVRQTRIGPVSAGSAIGRTDDRHGGGDRPMTRPALVGLGLWFGLLTGLGESHYLLWRAFILGQPVWDFRILSLDSLWMAPLAATLAFLVVSAGMVAITHGIRSIRTPRVAVAVYVGLCAFTWVMVSGRAAWWAAALFAAGAGGQVSWLTAGRTRDFQPLVRQLTPWLVGTALAIALSVGGHAFGESTHLPSRIGDPPPNTTNVLLVVLDTQRAASTSLYTSRRRTTPNLETLAQTSVVFDQAIATSPWTLPSHGSMFTGRHNRELGVTWFTPLDERYPTLAEVLHQRGYATAGFVANLSYGNDYFGLDRGFAHYDDQPRSFKMMLMSSWLTREPLGRIRKWVGNEHLLVRKRASDVNREFDRWLDRNADRPFFVFLNYFDAHDPYLPPAPFDTLFGSGDGRYHIDAEHDVELYDEAELQQLEAAYDAGIAYLDEHLGLMLASLEGRGLLGETLVVITSDHGESFGEHGLVGHGNTLHMQEVHVPLLIRPPGPGVEPRRIPEAISLRDLPATVLDVLGIEPDVLPGRSLAGYLTGEPATPAPGPSAVSQLDGGWYSLVGNGHHYIRRPDGREELYDVISDAREEHDLSGQADRVQLLQAFREELDLHLAGAQDDEPRR